MTESLSSSETNMLKSFRQDLNAMSTPRESKADFVQNVRESLEKERESVYPKPNYARLIKEIDQKSRYIKQNVHFQGVGTVQRIGNGVATLSGLPAVQLEEIVTFPTGVQGMVLNLDRTHVDLILLGHDEGIRGGDLALATGKRLSIPVGLHYLGRVIDPLGKPLDELGAITPTEFRHLERIAPSIINRAPVNEPLYTGTKILDALIPLGRGQRELILGDRQTGKTTLALDTILNQKGSAVKCIYVAIAQKKTSVISAIEIMRAGGVLPQTNIIISSPDDPPALRYLAPYAGVTLAEFLLDQGQDVLIIYDDLSKHADAYRELSLLLRRPPGREAYPGDIFYLHARLLERACKLNSSHGGGSITALPIATTQQGNISAYIPTNLISITDGQIVLDTNLFNKGIKPAIDIGRSVSRVGGSAQEPAMKSLIGDLRLQLSQYEEVARFARFGTEVNEATQRQIDRGIRLVNLLGQAPHTPLSFSDQIILFYALTKGFIDKIRIEDVSQFENALTEYTHQHANQLIDSIERYRELNDQTIELLERTLNTFIELWSAQKRGAA